MAVEMTYLTREEAWETLLQLMEANKEVLIRLKYR